MSPRKAALFAAFALLGLALACGRDRSHGMRLSSRAFALGAAIPVRNGCSGENLSPPLAWSGAPAGTRSFVLVVEDLDARNFTHWVLFNVAGDVSSLPEGLRSGRLPAGAAEGGNDFGEVGWGGPCPPSGKHRYIFRLDALDVPALTLVSPTKQQLEAAMEGHVLAQAELVGTYRRP